MAFRPSLLLLILLVGSLAGLSQSPKPQQSPSPTAAAGSQQSATPSLILSPNERFEYDKLRLEHDIQRDTNEWVQWRFWSLAALIVLVGFFGVRAFVREMIASELKDAARAAAHAEAAAKHSTEVTNQSRVDADKYKTMVTELSDTATKVDERFKALDARITAEGAHAVASSDLQLSQLSAHVQELSEVVKRLASESRQNRDALQKYEARIQKVDEVAANKKAKFSENSKYSIQVVHQPKEKSTVEFGRVLLRDLTSLGYRASSGVWGPQVNINPDRIKINYRNDEVMAQRVAEIVNSVAGHLKRDISVSISAGLHESYKEDIVVLVGTARF